MTWFERLMGFAETGPDAVRGQLRLQGQVLTSRANGRRVGVGTLTTPSLAELRVATAGLSARGSCTVREVVGDVAALHADPASAGALFQAASQFNLLEMASYTVTPEAGVGIYEHDRTQGPACAQAAGGGTIYRNYLVPCGGGVGQTADRQLDMLADVGVALGQQGERLWQMRNGYALCTAAGLREIGAWLAAASAEERDTLGARLRIGVHADVEVTRDDAGHAVTQVYGSALPVAYGEGPAEAWEPFARLVLEASYEATLRAAWLHAADRPVYLTLLGGGVFGNRMGWILDAIRTALQRVPAGLDVAVVSYGHARPELASLLTR